MLIKKKASEATEVTCVNQVQDSSNACSCAAQLKAKDESNVRWPGSMQTGSEGTSLTNASESRMLCSSESGTDILDMHDISRFWELQQSGGSTDAVCTR